MVGAAATQVLRANMLCKHLSAPETLGLYDDLAKSISNTLKGRNIDEAASFDGGELASIHSRPAIVHGR